MLPTMRTGSNGCRQVGSCWARGMDTLATSRTSRNTRGMAADYRPVSLAPMKLRLKIARECAIMGHSMSTLKGRGTQLQGKELITLAQKLARDAERHAILSASLASQADRLMVAGLRLLERRSGAQLSRST